MGNEYIVYDTIPKFAGTWMKFHGNIAGFQMAMTVDDTFDVWANTACLWFSVAIDERPRDGILY